ncbi:hypothetical protein DIPPA_01625 [Diplonema papillatum]|nr:hypothetical protein DIPPA_01625 [Diplonema papillatum]
MENGSLVFWDLAAAFAAVPPGVSTGAAPADWPATRVLRTAFAHTASLVSFMVQPARTQLPPAASGQVPEPSQPSSPFGHSSTFAAHAAHLLDPDVGAGRRIRLPLEDRRPRHLAAAVDGKLANSSRRYPGQVVLHAGSQVVTVVIQRFQASMQGLGWIY